MEIFQARATTTDTVGHTTEDLSKDNYVDLDDIHNVL